jgi:hypothetical protein
MAMKGTIQPNHLPKNKGRLVVAGQPVFVFTSLGDIAEEVEKVDMPDRTTASGGQKKPVEFTATIPAHHDAEVAAIEAWFVQGQDPVHPLYKKVGTLIQERIGFGLPRVYALRGLWVSRRQIPGSEMANEGELQQLEITFQADEALPVS